MEKTGSLAKRLAAPEGDDARPEPSSNRRQLRCLRFELGPTRHGLILLAEAHQEQSREPTRRRAS